MKHFYLPSDVVHVFKKDSFLLKRSCAKGCSIPRTICWDGSSIGWNINRESISETHTEDGVSNTKQAALAALMPTNCSGVFLRTLVFVRAERRVWCFTTGSSCSLSGWAQGLSKPFMTSHIKFRTSEKGVEKLSGGDCTSNKK